MDQPLKHDATFNSWIRIAVLVLVICLGGGLLSDPANAQTPVTTIKNGNGDVRFELNHNGSLYVPGLHEEEANNLTPNDSIPASGVGTRMMWYPAKAAFRAGRIDNIRGGTDWDASNVGVYSVAFGLDTRATKVSSVAMGTLTSATGIGSMAMGFGTVASDSNAVALGTKTTASGVRAMAVGRKSEASGVNATAMGINSTAQSYSSLAIGRWNTISGDKTSWVSTDPLLVAGNGGGDNNRSNALLLRKNGNMTIAGTLTESSDRRLKTDIQELGSVLDDLEGIEPVHFRFKEGTGHPQDSQIGLIAQEVEEAFPELVEKGSDGYLSLAYPKLTAVLLQGLQEQQATIEKLKKKNKELYTGHEATKERVNALEDRLAQIEAQVGTERSVTAGLGQSWIFGGLLLAFLAGGLFGAAFRFASDR